jgi:hypothetical protein
VNLFGWCVSNQEERYAVASFNAMKLFALLLGDTFFDNLVFIFTKVQTESVNELKMIKEFIETLGDNNMSTATTCKVLLFHDFSQAKLNAELSL